MAFALTLSSPTLAVTSPSAPALKKSEATYEIQSSIKGLGTLQEGIMAAGTGAEINGKVGLNEITVTAPGYATRKVRFWLVAGKKKTLAIDLAKMKYEGEINWKSSFKRFDPTKLEKKASLCSWYQNKAQERANCDRITFLDDIFYADDGVFRNMDTREYQRRGELNQFRALLAKIDQESSTPEIEDFYAKHASQASAFHLLSLHSLLQGDCPRINSIYNDAQQSMDRMNFLRLHMAICAESQNNQKLRDQLVASGIKGKNADPSLLYWAFQIQLPADLDKAAALAVLCSKSKPYDFRCQEAMAMTAKLQNKTYKMASANIEDQTFKSFLNIEDKLPKGQGEALYMDVAAQLETYPQSIENYLFMYWINAVASKDLVPDSYIDRRIQISTLMAGGTLDKIIEDIEKNDLTQLLPPIYIRRLRFDPADPNLWYRLIRSLAKAKQCPDMLNAVERGKDYLPKYNSSLLQMRGACEVELGRTKEALVTYSKIMEINPKVWSSPYNLATIYERLGKKKESYLNYKLTLELKPPADVLEAVKVKIIQLQPPSK